MLLGFLSLLSLPAKNLFGKASCSLLCGPLVPHWVDLLFSTGEASCSPFPMSCCSPVLLGEHFGILPTLGHPRTDENGAVCQSCRAISPFLGQSHCHCEMHPSKHVWMHGVCDEERWGWLTRCTSEHINLGSMYKNGLYFSKSYRLGSLQG